MPATAIRRSDRPFSQPPAPEPEIELSIVMPCLNEAETLAVCVKKAKAFLAAHNLSGEVIVADNGSTDG